MRRSGKRRMSPTAAMNVAATITLTPGDGHQPLDLGPGQRLGGDQLLDLRRSPLSRKSTWRRPASTVSRSLTGSCCSASQRPALDAEQIRRRRAVLQAAHQHRVDLVLRARARPHQLRAAREPAAHRADALIGRPHPVELPRPQQLGQRPRVEAIGLRARLADAGVARRDDDHPRDVRLEDPRDRPRIARHLQRDPVARVEALREQLQRLRPRLRSGPPSAAGPPRRSPPRRSRDGRPALPLSPRPPRRRRSRGRTGGQTTSTDPRSQRNRASRRGGH